MVNILWFQGKANAMVFGFVMQSRNRVGVAN